jgi:hypothetical protein
MYPNILQYLSVKPCELSNSNQISLVHDNKVFKCSVASFQKHSIYQYLVVVFSGASSQIMRTEYDFSFLISLIFTVSQSMISRRE